MHSGRLNRKTVTVILLAVVFILVLSLFSFPNDSGVSPVNTDVGTAVKSQQMAHPDRVPVNLTENAVKQQCMLAGNAVYRFFGAQRQPSNTVILIPYILCFTWLSVCAYHHFNKKSKKPLPIIAVPIGGNAPPFTLA